MELDLFKNNQITNKMEELTYDAKISVIKILSEIMNADSIVRDSEIKYINDVIKSFGLNENYKSDIDNMMMLQALSIIRNLSSEQKTKIAQMMGNMIIVDKDINYNEVKMYNIFCESCDIKDEFNPEEYPDCSLSGDFIFVENDETTEETLI